MSQKIILHTPFNNSKKFPIIQQFYPQLQKKKDKSLYSKGRKISTIGIRLGMGIFFPQFPQGDSRGDVRKILLDI